jgi:hypothetical protein
MSGVISVITDSLKYSFDDLPVEAEQDGWYFDTVHSLAKNLASHYEGLSVYEFVVACGIPERELPQWFKRKKGVA